MTDNKVRHQQTETLDHKESRIEPLDNKSSEGIGVSEKQQPPKKQGLNKNRLGHFSNAINGHDNKAIKDTLIRTDLKSALDHAMNSWDRLSKEVEGKPAPDQQQLNEVKRLLGELKNKLDQF